MNYHYLFGPVPSRRLGRSLGVDLVPHKTCSLNCIYCECGRTTELTIERAEYVPTMEVIAELNSYLSKRLQIDYITFSGAGEPTLHIGLGDIVSFLKTNFSDYKIALLTNGALFYQESLRKEVVAIDLILPSLDAADDEIFEKIDRPHRQIKIAQIISGLAELKKNQHGLMWLEVFIVPGINDHEDHISKLKRAIHRIKPDLVQLNSLDRPGAEKWVTRATQHQLEIIAEKLEWQIEIIAKFPDQKESKVNYQNIENAIIELIKRRPCTIDDLVQTLGLPIHEVNKYLDVLIKTNRIYSRQMERGLFYWTKAL